MKIEQWNYSGKRDTSKNCNFYSRYICSVGFLRDDLDLSSTMAPVSSGKSLAFHNGIKLILKQHSYLQLNQKKRRAFNKAEGPPKKSKINKHRAYVYSGQQSYSVDSIKHTVLSKVLLQIFHLVSIKNTVHWIFSRQINFVYCLY